MTKREAAIVSVYTGVGLATAQQIADYLTEKTGANIDVDFVIRVNTIHGVPMKEIARIDFLELEVI